MPKRGPPSQLVADFGSAFGEHFRAKRHSLSSEGSRGTNSFDRAGDSRLLSKISRLDLEADKRSDKDSGIVLVNGKRQPPLCLYFRAYKGEYVGDDDIYYAAYLRDRTCGALMRVICKKLSVDYAHVKEILITGLGESETPLSDALVGSLKAEQTLEVEFVPGPDENSKDLRMKIRL